MYCYLVLVLVLVLTLLVLALVSVSALPFLTTGLGYTSACIACYANALVKTVHFRGKVTIGR